MHDDAKKRGYIDPDSFYAVDQSSQAALQPVALQQNMLVDDSTCQHEYVEQDWGFSHWTKFSYCKHCGKEK